MLPIYDNRSLVGYAKSEEQARKLLVKTLQNIPRGWKITVKQRDNTIIDLPPGFIYSVHP